MEGPPEHVLAAADPGMMLWVPLMHSEDLPEVVVRRCRQVIDRRATPEEHERLITVTQIFTRQ